KAYILVFDGLADWEAAHALCEINKSDKFDVVTVGFSNKPVTTMGSFRILPDVTLDAVIADDTAIFILPGGDVWKENQTRNSSRFCINFERRGFRLRQFAPRL
ncbi:MAG TPA: DJ-1/PfpI family protein, partial [Pyrinomonadaceae bacterium]